MTDAPDGPPPEAEVLHASPVSQAGYTLLPNAIMLRHDLKPTTRLVYGYLKHLAWREHSDAVEPLRARVAADLGFSEDTVRLAIRELQAAPCSPGDERAGAPTLLSARRRGLGRTNVYTIHDPLPEVGESPLSGSLDSSAQDGGIPALPPSSERTKPRELTPHSPPPGNRPAKVARRPVKDAEYELAAAVLAEFNTQAGTRYSSGDFIAKIVMRAREHPDLDLATHARIIGAALADPWWSGPASPSVVYGNAAQFERSAHQAAMPRPESGSLTAEEMRDYGKGWGPGTGFETPGDARQGRRPDVELDRGAPR